MIPIIHTFEHFFPLFLQITKVDLKLHGYNFLNFKYE